jgi:hypothetical protein
MPPPQKYTYAAATATCSNSCGLPESGKPTVPPHTRPQAQAWTLIVRSGRSLRIPSSQPHLRALPSRGSCPRYPGKMGLRRFRLLRNTCWDRLCRELRTSVPPGLRRGLRSIRLVRVFRIGGCTRIQRILMVLCRLNSLYVYDTVWPHICRYPYSACKAHKISSM